MIYLDCASASPLYNFKPVLDTVWCNPNSQYAKPLCIESIIKQIYLGTSEINNYFTYYFSSCSEANQSIKTLGRKCFTTIISHPSLYGERVINVDSVGRVDLNSLEEICANNPQSIISIESINSEVGCVNDLTQIRTITNQYGCYLHLDINAGLMIRSNRHYDADILTFSTYKLGTPIGLGILFIKGVINFVYNSSTKPMYMLDWFLQSFRAVNCDKIIDMSKYWSILDDVCKPLCPYHCSHIFTAEFNTQGSLLYKYLMKNKIYCSRGYACNKGVDSLAYKKLGYNAKNVLRLSFNHLTEEKDLILGLNRIKDLAIKLRK